MSRIEAGRAPVMQAETDLWALASDVEATFRLEAREKGLGLEVVRAGELPRYVVTDEKKLRQIVLDLAGNAVKFTAKGSVKVRFHAAPGETRRRVLVVDDVPQNREVLRQTLERVGFEIETANDGERALARLEAWRPKLVLMDLEMPGTSGLEAIRAIRATEEAARRPLVAVTASAFDEDRHEVERAGGDAFVSEQRLAEWLGGDG